MSETECVCVCMAVSVSCCNSRVHVYNWEWTLMLNDIFTLLIIIVLRDWYITMTSVILFSLRCSKSNFHITKPLSCRPWVLSPFHAFVENV